MNPLTNMKNVVKLSEQELYTNNKTSWHDQYRDSAWVFVGGLPYDLTEGDIICIFSQYGEIVNINLIRAKDTGKSKGFCFICYEDQRSTVLAVDNFNGIKILNRTIRVDHVSNYKVPKEHKDTDEVTKKLYDEGCAPIAQPIVAPRPTTVFNDFRETIADQIQSDIKLPARLPIYPIKEEMIEDMKTIKVKKEKKDKKQKKKKEKKKKKKRSKESSNSSSDSESDEDSDYKKKKKSSSSEQKQEAESDSKKNIIPDSSRSRRSRSRSPHFRQKVKNYDRNDTYDSTKKYGASSSYKSDTNRSNDFYKDKDKYRDSYDQKGYKNKPFECTIPSRYRR